MGGDRFFSAKPLQLVTLNPKMPNVSRKRSALCMNEKQFIDIFPNIYFTVITNLMIEIDLTFF